MLHQLVSTAVIRVSFVKNVLANFIKGLCDVQVESEKSLNDFRVNYVVFVIKLLLLNKMQVVW